VFDIFKKTKEALKRTSDGWFNKVNRLFDRPTIGQDLWDELEELLISADVGVSTTGKLIERVKEKMRTDNLRTAPEVRQALKKEVLRILSVPTPNAKLDRGLNVVVVVGVNGSGKTTSIAKLAKYYADQGRSVLLTAADTFRAAAIDQLQLWGSRIGTQVIANKPGGDPGAVVFDALQAASSRGVNIVLIDTAGRLHTKFNLMEELKKIKRIAEKSSPASMQTILVLDATTGQNGLAQALQFGKAVELTGVFLSKLDGTAKGGIVLAICDQMNLPILFIGTGESIDDVAPFEPENFVNAIFETEDSSPPQA
jgi:fused signal recognition particle receptor